MLFTSQHERVPALMTRYNGNDARPYTVVFSHGNGEDMFLNARRVRRLSTALKCNVLSYDFVGYSTSRLEGYAPSEQGCYRAINAAYGYLTRDLGVAPENVILYGRSIGSGPTVHLASSRQCRDTIGGVVLECGILSAIKVCMQLCGCG